ncbi:hypothetical protein DFA_12001 [Cavenderia fasciculata]|uniref:Uncharacterized protein n=1 Tax=Cavenderia fasciculata TaxID=261658 RepID=F4QF77_CACFS|nr:uncharacterized protein DFA_12001 [Cavenderia fasciculata]EGG14231.1 hypothetical protein DFA_12001 [Cavenderia fasciculata]|eukprot:XP_004350940.1 hypothetical protein DFA_12001 [Cavenderia fasciculata]
MLFKQLANLSQIQTSGGYSSSANKTSTANEFNFQDPFTTQTSLGANKVAFKFSGDEVV